VLHENDPRIELETREGDVSDCLVPSQIKMEYKQLKIELFKAEEIPDMDAVNFFGNEKKTSRRCQGYVEIKYMGITKKTKVVEMEKEIIIWNQCVEIPVSIPAVSQKIVMTVKDQDVGQDDIVGSIEVKMDEVLNSDKYKNLVYVDIYGSSVNSHGGIYDQMNYNSEIGSKWKGRIWICIKVESTDTPVCQVKEIDDKDYLKQVYHTGRSKWWSIYMNLYSAFYLPDDKEYGFRLSIQEMNKSFPVKKAKNKKIEWNASETIVFSTFTDDDKELPDIFLYLTDKKREKNLAFQRIPCTALIMNKDIMVIKWIPEPCVKAIKSMMNSGWVKIRICVVNKQLNKNFNESSFKLSAPVIQGKQGHDDDSDELEDTYKQEKPAEDKRTVIQLKKYTVMAVVYMSRYLIAADRTGTSDPYVSLTCNETVQKTKVKANTTNGIWNEVKEFPNIEMDWKEQSTWPTFLLQVTDKNSMLKSDKLMGYNYVWLCDASYIINETNEQKTLRPRWHHLFLPKSNKKQGQILWAFFIFDDSHLNMRNNIKFKPDTIPYSCEINVLGLRQLKPLSLLPVKKAYIKFDMNSLNVTGNDEDALQPIQTVPGDGGADPTINTVFKFDARLPKDEIFIPQLQCEVYDNLWSGMMNSLLGVFNIDVKRIIKKTNIQIDEDMKITKKKFGWMLTSGLLKGKLLTMGAGAGVGKPRIAGLPNLGKIAEEPNTNDQLIDDSNSELQEKQKPWIPDNSSKMDNISIQKKEIDDPWIDTSYDNKDDIAWNISNSINTNSSHIQNDVDLTNNNVEIPDLKIEKNLTLQGVELNKDFLTINKDNSNFFVVYPVFKNYVLPGLSDKEQKEFLIEDEEKAPESSLFFKIGYIIKADVNSKPEESKKHYRRIYREPLESAKVLGLKSPFIRAKLKRGKYEDKKSDTFLFDIMRNIQSKILKRFIDPTQPPDNLLGDNKSESSQGVSSNASNVGFMGNKNDPNEKSFGRFKGFIRICEKKKMEEYEKSLKECLSKNGELIAKEYKNLNKYDEWRKKILSKKDLVVRIYVLELNNLAKKDWLSESDPYIKLYIGNKLIINEKKNHQDDQKNCKWYKFYDIPVELPGAASLKVEVWDYDDLLSDDLIGETIIDWEDRYFDSTWQDLVHKPVEVRPLLHPDISGSQGEAYMWWEIMDVDKRNESIPWSISPEPITPLELRFIVWETEDMEMMDIEGTSDIYVIGYVDMKDKQSTDVHFRCQTGAGSFNWRMLLPVNPPESSNILTIQVYDNDIFC
ncbi:MAG: hypothetical protein ACRC42_02120, partial [Mycoplasma sp.]